MRDILEQVDGWISSGKQVALATVINTWGSAPRKPGAHMAISEDGEIAGSVSGGCVESAVIDAALQVIKESQQELLHFGVADETAWEVGLACGGEIKVFVELFEPEWFEYVKDNIESNTTLATATVIESQNNLLGNKYAISAHEKNKDFLPPKELQNILTEELFGINTLNIIMREGEEPSRVFVNNYAPSPTLVIVGGAHISIALSKLSKILGYQIVIIDPRKSFGNKSRFPEVDELLQMWPDEAFQNIDINNSTAVVTLTHDPKIDDPALLFALSSPAFYIGALGSTKTHDKRKKRLIANGLTPDDVENIRGPVGIDIGASSAEEIALSIMAEITAVRRLITV